MFFILIMGLFCSFFSQAVSLNELKKSAGITPSSIPLHAERNIRRFMIERERRRMMNIPITNWFAEQIKSWAVLMQDTIIAPSVQEPRVEKLYSTAQATAHQPTYKVAIKLLDEVIQTYKKLPAEVRDNSQNSYLIGTICLNASLTLIKATIITLLDTIELFEQHRIFWKEQEQRPVHYFFHKSPLKWFSAKNQQEEITHAYSYLEIVINEHTHILGELMHYLHTFDTKASIEEQYSWINNLTAIINKLLNSNYAHNAHTLEKVFAQLSAIKDYQRLILKKSESALRPAHISRNWMRYALFAGMISYAIYDPHHLFALWLNKQAMEGYAKKGRSIFDDWIYMPSKEFFNTVWNGQKPEAPPESGILVEGKGIRNSIELLEKELDTINTASTNNYLKEKIAYSCQKEKEIISSINEIQKQQHISDEERAIFIQKLKEDDEGAIYQRLKTLKIGGSNSGTISELWKEGLNNYVNFDAGNEALANVGYLYNHTKKELFEIALLVYNQNRKMGLQLLLGILQEGESRTHSMDKYVQWAFKNAYTIWCELHLVAKLFTLIPAGLAGFFSWVSAKGFYNWATRKNYHPLQETLCNIEKIIIKSNDVMNYDMYGRLVYLLYKLKIHALEVLPIKDDIRNTFIHDVQELESYDFTPREKEKLINLMRKRYSFLK